MRTVQKASLAVLALLFFSFAPGFAQDTSPLVFEAETRLCWQYEGIADKMIDSGTGFRGKFLNIKLSGNISKNISYAYRQRLNRAIITEGFFNATDYLFINFTPGNWTLSAGKQIVLIGGYEYDRAPIDLYLCSEYWQNIGCYQFGASAGYSFEKDNLTLQVCQSPCDGMKKNLYAYNLMWSGSHGFFSSLWSANLIEYSRNKFIGYLTLGNSFQMGPARLQIDLMNRFSSLKELAFKDFSVMTELSCKPIEALNIFAKGTFDYNDSASSPDWCVLPGTNLWAVSGGVEYYPLKGRDNIRIYAMAGGIFGRNGNPDGTLKDKAILAEIGIKAKIGLLKLKKKEKENDNI